LHKVGSHRDLKLENIILKKNRKDFSDVAIIDFDTFTSVEDLNKFTARSTRVGTKSYISPEERAFRSRGPPSDIWSLGVVCLSLLGAAEIVLNHSALYHKPDCAEKIIDKFLRHVSREYKNILLSMFEIDCNRRSNASSLLISLKKIKKEREETN
jgi:serine/threonine protein kinase